jgi:hypothetical protein
LHPGSLRPRQPSVLLSPLLLQWQLLPLVQLLLPPLLQLLLPPLPL